MDVTSPIQENCLIAKCPGSKQEAGDQTHEFSFGNGQTEAVDTSSSTKENSLRMENLSSLNSLEHKHDCGSEDVHHDTNSSQTKENGLKITSTILEQSILNQKIESRVGEEQTAAIEFTFTKQSSSLEQIVLDKKEKSTIEDSQVTVVDVTIPPIKSSSPQQNILEQKQESDFQVVQSEAIDIACPTQENSLTINTKENVTGDVQCDTNSSQTKENGLVTRNSSLEQSILDQKDETGVGNEQTAAIDLTLPARENGTLQCSSIKKSILDQKKESTAEDVKIMSDVTLPTQENSSPVKSSGHEQNILEQKQESGFEAVQHEAIDIASPILEDSLRIKNPSPKQNLVEQKLEPDNGDGQSETPASKFAGHGIGDNELLETPNLSKNVEVSEPKKHRGSPNSKKKKHAVRSALSSPRVLRSRLRDTSKAPDPVGVSENIKTEVAKTRKKRKRTNKTLDNVFEKTKKRVRYLLNKTNYEHSLIEAYSGDGWKGLSAEKVRPEKELQRATAEILRCKLKIRDMFQHIESLCDEGKFQESLFDSDGEIDSEDIFCAKCGSKELSTDNDIILCDGFCTRGFHQKCLDPPLLNEEIPPGDEGWLCPACDCKADCIDLLNDNLGTDLSIEDNWEKVFPEAATTTAGNKLEDYLGLPSDDSEDDDYDPDRLDLDEQKDEEGSSSDESDCSFASDDVEDLPQKDPYLGLPSDDSDDDDYNPDAMDVDEQVNKDESSSSGFSSDSGDSAPLSDDGKGSLGGDEVRMPSSVDGPKPLHGSDHQGPKKIKGKKETKNPELRSILEQGDASPVSGKRNRKQFDYKKLNDETYGNVSSDSSDDEDWVNADGVGEGKNSGGENESVLSPKENSRTTRSGSNSKTSKNSSKKKENDQERTRQKLDFENAKNIVSVSLKEGKEPDLSKKRAPASKRRGKAVAQETHVSSDSREHEDLVDADGMGNKKDGHGKESVLSSNENYKTPGSGENTKNTCTLKRKSDNKEKISAKKLKFGGANNTASGSGNQGLEADGIEKRASAATKLGKAVAQRLFEALKENEYPTPETKEKLAEELGLTVRQVNKWFNNTRWSLRHPSGKKDKASPSKIKHVQTNGKNSDTEQSNLPSSDAIANVMPDQEPGSTAIDNAGKRDKASPSKNKLAQTNGKTGKGKQKNVLGSNAVSNVKQERELGSAVNGKAAKRDNKASPSKNKLAQTNGNGAKAKEKKIPGRVAVSKAKQEQDPGSPINNKAVATESSPQNLLSSKLRNKRRKSEVEDKTSTEVQTPVKPTNPACSSKSQTPPRRSSQRNTKQDATHTQEVQTPVKPSNPAGSSKSETPPRRSSQRNTKQEATQTQEVQTPVKPNKPTVSSKSQTPTRRSSRNTKQEATQSQVRTRSRRSIG
ncbi:hypothetical protein MKW98_003223 [Papaver atlanticum]|uniref:Uncharacterized protein n=1 Tax=Papaver atlanticum TaxID=357466 RepID=A0AAD4SNY8_9MAGN|nr:hypothetical protein MKW98_003223 [Papaver atlanticum]